jgi:AraC-like DNA-binding protein
MPYGGTPLFTINHTKRSARFNMSSNHFHDYFEMYYLFEGERNYFIKDKIYRVSKGDLVFINEYDLHKTTATGGPPGHERAVIYFRKEFFGEHQALLHSPASPFKNGFPVVTLQAQEQQYVESLLEKITTEFTLRRTNFEVCLQALALELFIFVLRCCEKTTNRPIESEKVLHSRVSDIVRFINENYGSRLTLAALSSQFYISPYYLSRIFKSATGFSFVEYITTIRIREAQKLLRETDRKISHISETVGFEDFAHFGRIFKKITQSTPMQYRKQFRRR